MLIKTILHKISLGNNFNKIKKRFRTFAKCTSMHGFVELYYAKKIFWVVLWLTLVVFAFGITTYQVIRATRQFVNQRPATSIELLGPEEYILPPLKACYVHWIYWLDWEKAYSLNFSRNSILYGMSFLTDVYSTVTFDTKMAEKEFLEKMNFNKFTRLTEFYVAVAKRFPMADSSEGHLLNNDVYFDEIQISNKASKTMLCYTTPGVHIIKAAYEHKSAMLMDSSWNGYLFNFSVQDQHYKLISKYFTPEEYTYYVVVWLKFNSIYWIESSHLTKDYELFGLPLYVFPNGYSEDFIQIDYENEVYRINVDITVRRWGHTKRGLCITGQKLLSADTRCYTNCQARYFAKVCECPRVSQTSIILEDFPSKLCPMKIFFLELLKKNTTGEINSTNNAVFYTKPTKYCPENDYYRNEYDRCQESCFITGCDEWTYTATVSMFTVDRSARKYMFKNLTIIDVKYPQPSDVEIVVEMDSQSWEDFIGNVGGLLGVWTGASIISFFQLCYLCCSEEDDIDKDEQNLQTVKNSKPDRGSNVITNIG